MIYLRNNPFPLITVDMEENKVFKRIVIHRLITIYELRLLDNINITTYTTMLKFLQSINWEFRILTVYTIQLCQVDGPPFLLGYITDFRKNRVRALKTLIVNSLSFIRQLDVRDVSRVF